MAVTLVLAAAAWRVSQGGIFSPGALHGGSGGEALGGVAAHSELQGDCSACHVSPFSHETMAQRCLACHTDVQQELPDSVKLHGSFDDAAECRACHTEHQGTRGSLTRMDDIGGWHDRLGFSLEHHRVRSDHQFFTCTDCHAEGSFRFDQRDCTGCHRKDRPDYMAAHLQQWGEDCLACHNGVRFARGVFDHDTTAFPIAGKHGSVECVECHPNTRTLAQFRSGALSCANCHRENDPHEGEFGQDCGGCHSTETWEGARFDHEFPLEHGSRRASECRVCHQDAPRRYTTYTCYGCHEHSEAGIRRKHLDEGIRDYQDCMECHPTGREDDGGGDEHEER